MPVVSLEEKFAAVAQARDFLAEQLRVPAANRACEKPDVDLILRAVVSGAWRRTSIDSQSLADTRKKIRNAIEKSERLEFSVPFGGYKSWRIATHPHLNWAEVFAVQFLRRHGARISEFVPAGVTFTLSYCGEVMDLVNNLPLQWQEEYLREMRQLLNHYSDDRVQFRLFDIAESFESRIALRDAVLANFVVVRDRWNDMSLEAKEKRITSARHNLVLTGIEDLRDLSPAEFDQRTIKSAMLCEALDSLRERREFNKLSSRIQLVHVRGPKPPAIHIASCDTSANHFGVGLGVVEVRKKRTLQRILTEGSEVFGNPHWQTNYFEFEHRAKAIYPGISNGIMIREI